MYAKIKASKKLSKTKIKKNRKIAVIDAGNKNTETKANKLKIDLSILFFVFR
jgi:hypothetical protein